MRIIFIPGFGEDESIFDKLHPAIPGKKLFLNNWKLLGNKSRPGLTVLQYARELTEQFGITKRDVIIGHSMGGWIALHIKHLVQCPVIQISSWTDKRKIAAAIGNRALIYWLAKSGLAFNDSTKLYLAKKYQRKISYDIFCSVFDNLIRGNKNNIVNQLRLIFNPVAELVRVVPDLRIHARADSIIYYPDQPTFEAPGDHFSLYTHPEKLYPPILSLLENVAELSGDLDGVRH